MGTYRKEWPCCGSVSETQSYEPEECPFCAASAPASTVLTDEREGAWGWDRRANAAQEFMRQYADVNMEKLLGDYDVQPIIRRLAAAILEWQRDAIKHAPEGVAAQAGQVAATEVQALLSDLVRPYGVFDVALHHCHRDNVKDFCALLDRARAVVAGQVAVPGWISVDERLPDSGYCLATYRNAAGKLRIIRAKYASQFEIDAGEDAIDQGNCEYNEADDTFYLKAGWLECIDNWDDYSSIYVTEGEVTHWSPLPAAPSPAKESK